MSIDIHFDFSLGETVYITELKSIGRVIALYVSETGLQYRVRYFYNGEAKDTYFYPDEIAMVKTT